MRALFPTHDAKFGNNAYTHMVHNHGEESIILHRTLAFFSMFELQYRTQDQVTAE